MYDELVKRMRDRAGAFDYDGRPDIACDYEQAADAIEKLSEAYDKLSRHMDDLAALMPRWIPVTERLPEEKTYVIILFDTIAGKMAGVCFLYKDDEGHNCWTWLDRIGRNLHDIQPTHWMPLPEPPMEEN